MVYATNAPCDEIYLMTLKDSRKYQNMCENPAVSLLIDTRRDISNSEHAKTMALTLSGRFQKIVGSAEREQVRRELFQRHPGLKDFFEKPEREPVKIIIESFLFLEGPTKAHHGVISDS
jgi:nitroimidazol reductase NimA-like FMN-containing flavoprotein (pyridoxamine 5'-phosphate oxidase superfamily)